MKILKATDNNYKGDIIKVTDCKMLGVVRDETYKYVKPSLLKDGMKYPILITDYNTYKNEWSKTNNWFDETDKYGVVTGNQRLKFAIEENYDYIEAIIVKSKSERNKIQKDTYIFELNL
jgi:hypothetical protein